ncbi:hypothetical protein [Thalassiella azotivora]
MSTGRGAPDYDFFGASSAPASPAAAGASPAGAPTVSRLGAPAVPPAAEPATGASTPFGGTPVNQFGTPLGVGPAVGAPLGGPPPSPARRNVPAWVWRVLGTLAVALVLGAFGVGRFAGLFEGDLEAPPTLDGLPRYEDAATTAAFAALGAQLSEEVGVDPQDQVMAVYTDQVSRALVLVAARADLDTADLRAQAADAGEVTSVGDAVCAVSVQQATTTCLLSRDGLMVAVIAPSATDTASVARLTEVALREL